MKGFRQTLGIAERQLSHGPNAFFAAAAIDDIATGSPADAKLLQCLRMFLLQKGDLFDSRRLASAMDDPQLRGRPHGVKERMGTVDEKIIERRC
jgi:hypothetical protein